MMHSMKMQKWTSHKNVLKKPTVLSFSFFPYTEGTPDNPNGYTD